MGHLPGPYAGALPLPGQGHGTVSGFADGHQRHLPLVRLGGGIHHLENTLGAGQSGEDGGDLLGDLVQRLAHLPGVIQIGGKPAQIKAPEHCQQTAHHGGNGIAHMVQVPRYGHHRHAIEPGGGGRLAVLLIELGEPGLGRILVGEGLHHFQPFYHLLNVAVDPAQRGLLLPGILPGPAAHKLDDAEGRRQNHQSDEEKQGADIDHHGHHAHEHQPRGDHRHHRILQRHLHVVGVVGKAAHQLAVGMAVIVGDGQVLQGVKQVAAEPFCALFGQNGHDDGLGIGSGNAHQIDPGQRDQRLEKIPGAMENPADQIVDQRPHIVGTADIAGHRKEEAQEYHHKGQLALGEIPQYPQGGSFCILGLGETSSARPAMSWSRHYSLTPSCCEL